VAPEIVACPVCGQKLLIQDYVTVGSEMVCANKQCESTLRIDSRHPLRVKLVPYTATLDRDGRPESYG
jgi:alpha-aminoadipate/glutamate carrier protein LysW